MTSAIYSYGRLIVAGGCHFCGAPLDAHLTCQRSTCGMTNKSLADLQQKYETVAEIAALALALRTIAKAAS